MTYNVHRQMCKYLEFLYNVNYWNGELIKMLNHDYTVYSWMPFGIFVLVSIRMYLCDLIKPHWDYVLLVSIIIICVMLSAQPLVFKQI